MFLRIARRTVCAAALSAGLALAASVAAAPNSYQVKNLVSDGFVTADHLDNNLQNGWGIPFNPTGFVWVSDNHTGLSTLYDGARDPQGVVVSIPPAGAS